MGARHFDGIVVEGAHRGAFENGWRYDLVLRPWLHVAGLRRNMRTFHNKTVIEIVQEVLSSYADLGDPHLEVKTSQDYPTLEYTVQYTETDADFVRRQLERHGITWSWTHMSGSHTMLLTDADFVLPQVPGGTRPFYGVDGYHRHEEEHFKDWSQAERITTGAVRLTEYNFKTPNAAQEVDHMGTASHARGDVESYDWPGDYLDQGGGKGVVRTRLDAERGQAARHRAMGDVVTLSAGSRVTLGGDDVPGATGRTFICLKAEHRFRSQAYGSGDSGGDETPYEGAYVLLPDDAPLRPEQRTVGPRVQGPETAVVVGEGEIDCDEHGRILVRFHWDDVAAHTMRVRVSQNWASKGWGGMIIPRIGMEVIVEHLRGDPDKPIVTGCVYNGANRPPYELPKHKTRSTFKTDTHQGTGFNELRFEDENGEEEIFVHAEKDFYRAVEDSDVTIVGNNSYEFIQNSRYESTANLKEEEVGVANIRRIGFADIKYVSALNAVTSRLVSPKKRDSSWGELDFLNKIALGKLAALIGKNGFEPFSSLAIIDGSKIENIGKDVTQTIGGNMNVTVEGSHTHDVDGRIDITAEESTVEVAGENLEKYAGENIVLNVGSASIVMKKNGDIEIEGNRITINGTRVDIN